MLKKALVVLSITTAFALVLATPPSALAKDHHKKQQVHKNVVVKKNVHVKNVYVVGKKYHGHVWYGHRRHRWHGKWYDYGVGPCWLNVGGLWFWNVAACP